MIALTEDGVKGLERAPFMDDPGMPELRGEGAGQRIQKSLNGDVDALTARGVRRMAETGLLQIDSIAEALLLHNGINPAVATAAAAILRLAVLERDDQVICQLSPKHTGMRPMIWLSRADGERTSCCWMPNDPGGARLTVSHMGIPETMRVRLIGEKVTRIVDHPVLHEMGCTIDAIEDYGTGVAIHLSGVDEVGDGITRHLPDVEDDMPRAEPDREMSTWMRKTNASSMRAAGMMARLRGSLTR